MGETMSVQSKASNLGTVKLPMLLVYGNEVIGNTDVSTERAKAVVFALRGKGLKGLEVYDTQFAGGDLAAQQNWAHRIEANSSGKRVLIVGAGPSGLSAGYHLRRLGHAVEIHEAGPIAGGLRIPAFPLIGCRGRTSCERLRASRPWASTSC